MFLDLPEQLKPKSKDFLSFGTQFRIHLSNIESNQKSFALEVIKPKESKESTCLDSTNLDISVAI